MLDPQARALLDLMIERGVPPTHTLEPGEARRLYRERRSFTQPPALTMAEVRDLSAPGPAGPIGLRYYRPSTAPASSGALVYYHGGGQAVVDRSRKRMFGSEPIVHGEHHATGTVSEFAAQHVVRVEVTDHPATTVVVHQCTR